MALIWKLRTLISAIVYSTPRPCLPPFLYSYVVNLLKQLLSLVILKKNRFAFFFFFFFLFFLFFSFFFFFFKQKDLDLQIFQLGNFERFIFFCAGGFSCLFAFLECIFVFISGSCLWVYERFNVYDQHKCTNYR